MTGASERRAKLVRMLIPMPVLRRIAAGEVDVAFRRWTKPSAKAGGTLRTAMGVVAIDRITALDDLCDVTEADARRSGAETAGDVREELAKREGTIYRIELHLDGDDPRVALRQHADLDDAEVDTIVRKLTRLDQASSSGPWTRATLQLISEHPERRAGDLAAMVRRDMAPFKLDVRKLKNLGLTESLLVGYRISPRGETILRRLTR